MNLYNLASDETLIKLLTAAYEGYVNEESALERYVGAGNISEILFCLRLKTSERPEIANKIEEYLSIVCRDDLKMFADEGSYGVEFDSMAFDYINNQRILEAIARHFPAKPSDAKNNK